MTAILGAGIAGLSAAYYALENPKLGPLVVLEASNRVGGWIRSIKQADGTVFEKGPRVMRILYTSNSALNSLGLIEELELSSKLIPIKMSHPSVKNRYIYVDNAIHLVPSSITGLMKKNSILNRPLSSIVLNDFMAKTVPKDDESIYSFIERRFGKDISEKLAAPVLCGISGGDVHELSAKSFMPKVFKVEQEYGSVFLGLVKQAYSDYKRRKLEVKNGQKSRKASMGIIQRSRREGWCRWGLEGGLEQLPQALAENISKRGVNMKLEHNCEKMIFNKDSVELTVNGKVEKYSRVISSLPARSLSDLVKEQHPELSKELHSIPTVTIAVVNLQYPANVLSLNGFGVLIAPKEKIPVLGVIFDSCIFPQNSKMTVLTVMMGGAWFEKYFGERSSEEHLKTVAIKYVNEILRIHDDPKACNVSVLKDCIPQYVVGHEQRLKCIHDYISAREIPLVLCGSSYHGIAVSDVILSAKEVVSNIDNSNSSMKLKFHSAN